MKKDSMKQKIFNILVKKRQKRTVDFLAFYLNSTRSSVTARVSEIRADGYPISVMTQKHRDGSVTRTYEHKPKLFSPAR